MARQSYLSIPFRCLWEAEPNQALHEQGHSSTKHKGAYQLDPNLFFFFFSPLKKIKTQQQQNTGKNTHTLICWNGIICRSHLDLFGEAKGRSVTVKCTDFCILSPDELFRCSIDNICISAKLSGPPFFFIQRPRLFVQDLAPTLNHRISEKKQLLFLLL